MEKKRSASYEDAVKKPLVYQNVLIVWSIHDSDKIFVEDQALFWSGNGMFLYLVKHARQAIANAFWKLSKVMDGENPTFLEMNCMIKYALDTSNLWQKIEPNGNKR